MQQQRNRTKGSLWVPAEAVSGELRHRPVNLTVLSLQLAYSWETDPSEVVAGSRPWRRRGIRGSPHHCEPLCNNAEFVVTQPQASEDRNHLTVGAEESTALLLNQ